MKTVETAPAKINLALHVLGRRADGYHLLDSIVVFTDIADRITIEPAPQPSFAITGPFAADLATDQTNIVLQAELKFRSIAITYGIDLPPLAITLEKNLPVASGIGGGSADAAATLRALQAQLENTPAKFAQDIERIALSLGADVPVCLRQTACRMQGVGEVITPLKPPVPSAILLVNPLIPLATKAVFSAMNPESYANRPGLAPGDPTTWRNDMKAAAIHLVPEIAEVLSAIEAESCFKISNMSGSGATCFGLAASLEDARSAAKRIQTAHPGWWVRAGRIINLE